MNHLKQPGNVNLGLITPFSFNAMLSSNEVATEDKGSVAVTGRRPDTLDIESEELSNRMRPESGEKKKKKQMDHLLKDYRIEPPALQISTKNGGKCASFCSKVKLCLIVASIAALVFAMCMNAFYVYQFTNQGLAFLLYASIAAAATDVAI